MVTSPFTTLSDNIHYSLVISHYHNDLKIYVTVKTLIPIAYSFVFFCFFTHYIII